MNIKEFTSSAPKPWLNVFSTTTDCKNPLWSAPITLVPTGAGAFTLSAEQLVSSIVVIPATRTVSIGAPTDAAIDAYLGPLAVNGAGFSCRVVNKEITANIAIGTALIPKPAVAGYFPTVNLYFKRIEGIWVSINT